MGWVSIWSMVFQKSRFGICVFFHLKRDKKLIVPSCCLGPGVDFDLNLEFQTKKTQTKQHLCIVTWQITLALLTLTNHIPSFLKGTHLQPIFPVPSPLQKIPSAPNDSDPSHDVVKRKPQETPKENPKNPGLVIVLSIPWFKKCLCVKVSTCSRPDALNVSTTRSHSCWFFGPILHKPANGDVSTNQRCQQNRWNINCYAQNQSQLFSLCSCMCRLGGHIPSLWFHLFLFDFEKAPALMNNMIE